jgi:hypothetical protein
MREQLLGYLIGALDPEEEKEVELSLQASSRWRQALDELRRQIEPLRWDAGHLTPPPGLALRTCQYVARRAVAMPSREFAGRSARWSIPDYLVAASILVAATLLFVPAMGHSRTVARIAQCQNNLRQIGAALVNYSDAHGRYMPYVPPTGNLASSGAFGPRLVSAGLLPDARLLFCPNSKKVESGCPVKIPSVAEVERATGAELERLESVMGGDYRATLGHIENGFYRATRDLGRPYFAYLSDAPHHMPSQWLSLNHDSCGQNVLFEDGHVEFLKTRRCIPKGHPDDIFANSRGELAPGTSVDDSVIVPGRFSLPPGIQVTPVDSR